MKKHCIYCTGKIDVLIAKKYINPVQIENTNLFWCDEIGQDDPNIQVIW